MIRWKSRALYASAIAALADKCLYWKDYSNQLGESFDVYVKYFSYWAQAIVFEREGKEHL